MLNKLITDLSSEEYHGLTGTWSSSQLKDILDDEEFFVKKHIKKEIEREERAAFDTGTYFHTAVLEPHKISEEIAVFEGRMRVGKKWEIFKLKNKGKCLITLSQKEQGDRMVRAVNRSNLAQEYLDGECEISLFIKLTVWKGKIFSKAHKKVLTRDGWKDYLDPIREDFSLIVKVRADTLGDHYISDLKSTSGNPRSISSVRNSISKYIYDLSAALYLDMFSLVRPKVNKFKWIFASKDRECCATWRATKDQILVGRAKYMKAILRLSALALADWEVPDYVREADPLPHEREWLLTKEERKQRKGRS